MTAPIHANGFAPRLSPDGRLVLSGFGIVTLADLESGQSRTYGVAGHSFPAGWLSNTVGMYVVDRNDATADAFVIDLIDGFTPIPMQIDPSHLAPQMSADAGHWCAATPSGIYFDDQVLPNSQRTLNPRQRGKYVLAQVNVNPPGHDDAQNYLLRVWGVATGFAFWPRVPAYVWDITDDGVALCYAGDGLLLVRDTATGVELHAMVAPSGLEFTPCLVYGPNHDLWLWSSTYDATGSYVIGRLPGEQDVIRVDVAAGWLDVIFDGAEFVIAGCDTDGSLRVEHVSPNAPRVRLTAPVPPPGPPQPPAPPPVPPQVPKPPKPPQKPPNTPVPTEPDVKSRDQFYREFQEINAFYAAPDGLQRPGGMVIDRGGVPTCDAEAMGAWGYALLAEDQTPEQVKDQIRQSQEYRDKHP